MIWTDDSAGVVNVRSAPTTIPPALAATIR